MRPKHKDIVEYYLEQNLANVSGIDDAKELTDKLDGVIDRLINKEGILIVITDSEDKHERVLSLNINYDVNLG
jgi:hypothetical protein